MPDTHVTITGNLTDDPEVTFTPNGAAATNFRVAVTARIKDGEVKELILATNPTLEGEATAMYLGRLVQPMGIKATRLARGLPVGGDLEYADDITLSRALEGRQEL